MSQQAPATARGPLTSLWKAFPAEGPTTPCSPLPRALRSDGDVGGGYGADFCHFLGLLQSKLLIGCFFHLLLILFEQQKQVTMLQSAASTSWALRPACCLHRSGQAAAPASG